MSKEEVLAYFDVPAQIERKIEQDWAAPWKKKLRIIGILTKIWIMHLPNVCQKRYHREETQVFFEKKKAFSWQNSWPFM
jgi:ribosomal protein L11 methylase PrmA